MTAAKAQSRLLTSLPANLTTARPMPAKLFDSTILSTPDQALDFIGNILESSTEYSIIGKDFDGRILLWNEGARHLYGYGPEEVVGKRNDTPFPHPKLSFDP
jgi:PAS domain-containing protein